MRSHSKAPSRWPVDPMGEAAASTAAPRCISLAMGFALALVLLLLSPTPRAHASLGVDAYWGSNFGEIGTSSTGGRFGKAGPNGVAIYEQTGDVYVADSAYHRIQRFDQNGNFISAWGQDVVTGAPTTFEVCASAASCKTGITLAAAAATGGAMSTPAGIAVNQTTGHVYVSDTVYNRIQEFTPAGVFVRAFGQDVVSSGPGNNGTGYEICVAADDICKAGSGAGNTGGVLASGVAPLGFLAVAPVGSPNDGNVLVADRAKNRVQEFSSSGAFVRAFGWDVIASGQPNDIDTSFEVCTVATECKQGAGGGGVGQFPAFGVREVTEDLNGNIYTVEASLTGTNGRVQRFTLSGGVLTPHGTFDCDDLCASTSDVKPGNLAVDGDGFLYVVKPFPRGAGDPVVTQFPGPPPPANFGGVQERVLKVDPAANGGAGDVVDTLLPNTGGEPGVEGDGSLANYVAGISGLASTSLGSRLYVATSLNLSSSARSRIYRLGEISGLSGSVSATAVGATSVSLEATVQPAATLGHVKTLYNFEYRREGTTEWIASPSAAINIGNGSAGGQSDSCSAQEQAATCHVSGEIDGLALGRTYEYRLVARTSYRGSIFSTAPQEFTTEATPPAVTTGGAAWGGPPSSAPSLTFSGSINPQGASTNYLFEYVGEDAFQTDIAKGGDGFAEAQTAPAAPISAGRGTKTLDAVVAKNGIDPSQEYRFRLVASNAAGTSRGNPSIVAPSRAGGRFVELVSAGDSQGADVFPKAVVSDDGERVAFTSLTFGSDQQAAHWINNPAIAQRGAGGWTTKAMAGDPRSLAGEAFGGGVGNAGVTQRLWGTKPEPETVQWVVRNLDGTLVPVTPVLSPLDRIGVFDLDFQGGSGELSTLVFSGGGSTLFPGEPLLSGTTGSNLYEVSGAGTQSPTVSLLNQAAGGGTIGGTCGASLGAQGGPKTNAISANGSVVYFSARPGAPASGSCGGGGTVGAFSSGDTVLSVTAGSFAVGQVISGTNIAPGTVVQAVGPNTITISPPTVGIGSFFGTTLTASFPTRIFKRVGNASPVEIDQSQCARVNPEPACATVDGDDLYWGASANGSKVFFTSIRQLTSSDTDSTSDLYLYDSTPPPGQPNLVQVSAGEEFSGHTLGSGADVAGVVDFAQDGSRIYFVARGRLTPQGAAGANNLYVYERDDDHPSGRIHFVAALAPGTAGELTLDDPRLWKSTKNGNLGGKPAYAVGGGGHVLVFISSQQLDPSEDHDSVNDLYRYNDETEQIACLSCVGEAAERVEAGGRDIESAAPDELQASRVVSEDGSKVVFATNEKLLADDTNAVEDVYLWDDDATPQLSLVSGATGATGTRYLGFGRASISRDGMSVFFATRATLLPQDLDNGAIDIYAARVDGGFRQEDTSVTCSSEDGCRQVQPPLAPSAQNPSTSSLIGSGNVKVKPKRCKKNRMLRKGKCVPRKHKGKKHKKSNKGKKKKNRGGSGQGAGR